MKKLPLSDATLVQAELRSAKAKALSTEKTARAEKEKARLAKHEFKQTRKAWKEARKSAKKAVKLARRARKELKSCLGRVANYQGLAAKAVKKSIAIAPPSARKPAQGYGQSKAPAPRRKAPLPTARVASGSAPKQPVSSPLTDHEHSES